MTIGDQIDGLVKDLEREHGVRLAEFILTQALQKLLHLDGGTIFKHSTKSLSYRLCSETAAALAEARGE